MISKGFRSFSVDVEQIYNFLGDKVILFLCSIDVLLISYDVLLIF